MIRRIVCGAEQIAKGLYFFVETPTPAMTISIADHPWSIGELIHAALGTQSIKPIETPPVRRRHFRVIKGDLFD